MSDGEGGGLRSAGKWRWLLVGSTFLCLFLNGSMGYITGVVHVALLQTHRYDVEELTWLGSLFNCMFALTGPLASLVIRVGGCRVCVFLSGVVCLLGFSLASVVVQYQANIWLLFFTYAFLAGLGRGLAYMGSLVILGLHFPADSSLVTGMSICGVGVGMFVHPRLTQALIDTFGLSGGFLIIGAITSHSCAFSLIMREPKQEDKMLTSKKRQYIESSALFEAIKNTSFMFFLLATTFFSLAFATVFVLLPDFFHKHGATVQEAALCASITGLGGFMSRVLVGIGANEKQIGPSLFFAGCTGCLGLLSFFIKVMVTSSTGRYIYAFTAGLYTGGIFSILSPITLDRVGVDIYAFCVGLTMFSSGIGCLVGPPIAVAIWEASGYYYTSFLFAGLCLLLASASCFVSELFKHGDAGTDEMNLQMTMNVADPGDKLVRDKSSQILSVAGPSSHPIVDAD